MPAAAPAGTRLDGQCLGRVAGRVRVTVLVEGDLGEDRLAVLFSGAAKRLDEDVYRVVRVGRERTDLAVARLVTGDEIAGGR